MTCFAFGGKCGGLRRQRVGAVVAAGKSAQADHAEAGAHGAQQIASCHVMSSIHTYEFVRAQQHLRVLGQPLLRSQKLEPELRVPPRRGSRPNSSR